MNINLCKISNKCEPRNKIYLETSLQHISNNKMPKIKFFFSKSFSKTHHGTSSEEFET